MLAKRRRLIKNCAPSFLKFIAQSNFIKVKKWFKRNLTWVYFTIAILFILFPSTDYSPFSEYWNNLFQKIGFVGLTSGVFASVLKSIQFTGLFQEELTKIISGTEFLNNRKDLPDLWKKISKSIYAQKFPEISDLLEDRILTTYFPIDKNHYNEDLVVSIVIHSIIVLMMTLLLITLKLLSIMLF